MSIYNNQAAWYTRVKKNSNVKPSLSHRRVDNINKKLKLENSLNWQPFQTAKPSAHANFHHQQPTSQWEPTLQCLKYFKSSDFSNVIDIRNCLLCIKSMAYIKNLSFVLIGLALNALSLPVLTIYKYIFLNLGKTNLNWSFFYLTSQHCYWKAWFMHPYGSLQWARKNGVLWWW